jgi:drug/metabolite transporter (DMT)-like permease
MTHGGLKPYVWMLCGCFWFSLMAISANSLSKDCDWQVIAVCRSALATIFAIMIAKSTGVKLTWKGTPTLWLRSIAGSCSMVATFYALTHMEASDVLTITNTFPMWVALLSWPVLGERPALGVWIAVTCSIIGVGIVQQPTPTGGLAPAAWAALAASMFTAIAMLGLNRLRSIPSMAIVVHFSAVSTLFCGLTFIFDQKYSWQVLEQPSVLWRLFSVGFTATIGQVFLTLAFSQGQATKVAVVGLSQVVMVMIIEAIFGRTFGWLSLIGTLLVLGPTGWIMSRERRTVPPPQPNEHLPEEVAIE